MSKRSLTAAVAGRRSKWLVAALWLIIAGVVVPLASKLEEVQTNDAVTWLPADAEATRAFERARAAFPGADRLVAIAVYVREGGLTAADRAKIDADRAAFAGLAEGGRLGPNEASDDGEASYVAFPVAGADEAAQGDNVIKVKDRLAQNPPEGLQTALTGSGGAVIDIVDAFSGIDGVLLIATASVVALLLLITYRSPVLWLIPLLAVGVAAQVASGLVYLLAKYAGLVINGQSQGIMTVLVFGAGTDYALLLIARYREELRRHEDRHEAMAVALRQSFPAILASAATVSLGLLCLLAAQLNNVSGLGPVGAIGVACALVGMATLLPAMLVLCGRWLFWPFVPRYVPGAQAHDVAEDHGIWRRISAFVGRRPRMVWLGTAVVLGALTLGVTNLSLGLPQSEGFTKEVGSIRGQQLVAAHYDQGTPAPVQIYARADQAAGVAAAARVPGVAQVAEPRVAGEWAEINAILASAPDSAAAKSTVDAIRAAVHAVPEADALVGGDTAIQLDTERAADRDNKVVIPLILGVVLLVLIVLLRAVVAPLLLVASVVLSFAAAAGAAGLIFAALDYPKIDWGSPLLWFLFLVALGVDYTIFLMTRAREEAAKLGHRDGVLHALTVTGGVITSAGLVLAATFAVLGVLPLVPLLQLGIVVAVGVLLDTLVVRTLLVPALSVDAGRRIWWPSRLAQAPAVTPATEPERASVH